MSINANVCGYALPVTGKEVIRVDHQVSQLIETAQCACESLTHRVSASCRTSEVQGVDLLNEGRIGRPDRSQPVTNLLKQWNSQGWCSRVAKCNSGSGRPHSDARQNSN